jgi:GntR family transcriptional regulator/MocR family aminotransferase
VARQSSGALIAPLAAADGERVPQRVRVYQTVLAAIRQGSLGPGTRLPSARVLAEDWQVARSAVDEAFEQLQIEGLLERRVGDGTYVRLDAALAAAPPPAPVVREPSLQARLVLQRFAVFMGKPRGLELPHVVLAPVPLFPRTPMTDVFPLDTWRRLVARAHTERYRPLLTYGPAAGLPQAREAIARHLALTRGTRCDPAQVLVLNSPMQALELIVRVLLEPGDTVWVEDPGHASLPPLLRALHTRVVGVPFDDQGLDVAAGRALAPRAAAVYLHPLTQFPLGVRTTSARRAELLQWADECGAWVIEGNFNDEVVHDADSPRAFQSLDRSDRVLLMGTLEGIVYPSLRLAYLVVPQRLTEAFVAMRGLLGDHSSNAMQLALAWFVDEGHMANHLRTLRRLARERRDAFVAAAQAHLPQWVRIGPVDTGMQACVHLPAEVVDIDVVKRARERGVIAVALSSMSATARALNGLVLGYAAFEPRAIDKAMQVVGDVLRGSAR